jgi:hypothetical protein
MKTMWFAAAAVLLVAAPALAGSVDNMYGNTVLITNSKGETSTSLLESDGTYKTTLANGQVVSGKWEIRDGKFCATPAPVEGQPAPAESCGEYVDGKNVGDKWTQKGADEETITVEIKAGR